jgi:ribonuclease III
MKKLSSFFKEKEFPKLEKKLKLKFRHPEWLIQAFVHSSFLNEHPDFPLANNERLEFLGDAVLELVVSKYLYSHCQKPEGWLTKWRAALVNTHSLAALAEELNLGFWLLSSRGEKKNNQRAKEHLLANTLEALIGALYLDRGLAVVEKFVYTRLLKDLPSKIAAGDYQDAKTVFQERTQKEKNLTPHYEVLSETGPDHVKRFQVGVFLNDVLIAQGEGSSKKEAEEKAARQALEIKNYYVKNSFSKNR